MVMELQGHLRRCLAVVALMLGASLTLAPFTAGAASAAGANRAGVIVDEGNGIVKRVGITFDGSISGITALQLAGFSPSVRSFGGIGGAVCALDIGGTHYGCPTDATCLTCADPDYWAYARAPAGTTSFTSSRVGAGATQVHNGDLEGWRWGTGDNPAYVPLDSFFPPPTTTSVAAPPTTTSHVTTPTTQAPVHVQQVPPSVVPTAPTAATTVAPTSTTAGKQSRATTTTHAHHTSTTTAATAISSADARAGPHGGARQLAAGPPIVHTSSGSSPTGWIAFAVIVALFAVAIVAAHRRRARAATE
jgi:hypothetical protein